MADAATVAPLSAYKAGDLARKALAGRAEQRKAGARLAASELRAYAKALTQLAKPYTFSKKDLDSFVDNGRGGIHDYGGERDSGGPQYSLGGLYTKVGTVDYLAAALVDPEFMELCRQRAKVTDNIYGHAGGDPEGMSFYFDAFAEEAAKRPWQFSYDWSDGVHALGIMTGWGDSARGIGIVGADMFNNIYYNKAGIRAIGARARLSRRLDRKFKALLADPVKGPAIERVRRAFQAEYEGAIAGEAGDVPASPLDAYLFDAEKGAIPEQPKARIRGFLARAKATAGLGTA